MQSGNGIDLGAVYQLLTEVAQRVRGIDGRIDTHDRKLGELISIVNDHTHRLDRLAEVVNGQTQKIDDVATGLSDLRAAVTNYHGAVLGHGIMLSELDERVRRIERHLKLEPAGE